MLSRRVDLPSGGYLMIDYAEALTVIDINTGSFTGRGKGRLEDTITKVNVEAAEEVVRQLRMRDIGGIIVIDFIDMARAKNRDQVLKTLRTALDQDRTKTYVVEVSPLGLVEMTRQNVTDGVREILTKPCPVCDGEGVVSSEETVAITVVRNLARRWSRTTRTKKAEAFLVRVNPLVAAELMKPDSGLAELEEETGKRFHFEGGDALPLDTFVVVETGGREEIEQRALPFSVGDEVLVSIEEPHMYNVDDASRAWTPTSSASPPAARTSASAGWSGSRASGAPPRPRCCSTSRANGRRRRSSANGEKLESARLRRTRAPRKQRRPSVARQGIEREAREDACTQSSRQAESSTRSRRARPCSSTA